MGTFFKEVEPGNASRLVANGVPSLDSYLPNSVIYVILYILALPPNVLLGKFKAHLGQAPRHRHCALAYMGLKPGLINSRVKYPTLGMTLANLFGLVGFLILNAAYLFAVVENVQYSLFMSSFLRTVCYNSTYVCYFLFPLLAIDQYLFVCKVRYPASALSTLYSALPTFPSLLS